jgi:hypothetical protein
MGFECEQASLDCVSSDEDLTAAICKALFVAGRHSAVVAGC